MCIWDWVEFSLSSSSTSSSSEELVKVSGEGKKVEFNTRDVLNGEKHVVESTYVRVFESSKDTKRIFCGKCGTNLTLWHDDKEATAEERRVQKVDIAFGSLDPEYLEWEALKPVVSGYESSGIGWVRKLVKEGEKSLYQE